MRSCVSRRVYVYSAVISRCFIPSDCKVIYSRRGSAGRVKIIAEKCREFSEAIGSIVNSVHVRKFRVFSDHSTRVIF